MAEIRPFFVGALPAPYSSKMSAFSPGAPRSRLSSGASSNPGISRSASTAPSISGLTRRGRDGAGSTAAVCTRISVLTVARGGKFGEKNASRLSELSFLHRQPRSTWSRKKTTTSGMREVAATRMDTSRFLGASDSPRSMGSMAPVTTTGLARFSSMKLSADAQYAKVSVPITTTNPSKSL
jgi:hypothetical protein